MSDIVPHKGRSALPGGRREFRRDPRAILFTPHRGAELQFADSTGRSTCLGCDDAPCMELSEANLTPSLTFAEFPRDPSREVCPTGAMDWDGVVHAPTIDVEKCVGCGLCAVHCPYGAIMLSDDGIASVQKHDLDDVSVTNTQGHRAHVITARQGALGGPNAPFAKRLPMIAASLSDIQRSRMVRNMLLACGVAASLRRKGDTNIRMDGLLHFASGKIGVFELEISAVLESPRALLEDIAVLHGRFDVPMADIVPVSIVAALPNVRVEYYQVMDDISKVLDIRCHTLTLGALCMLMWRFNTLEGLPSDLFTTVLDSDLHTSLAKLDSDISPKEPHPGAYRPAK